MVGAQVDRAARRAGVATVDFMKDRKQVRKQVQRLRDPHDALSEG